MMIDPIAKLMAWRDQLRSFKHGNRMGPVNVSLLQDPVERALQIVQLGLRRLHPRSIHIEMVLVPGGTVVGHIYPPSSASHGRLTT
jgi:hypothetical protein